MAQPIPFHPTAQSGIANKERLQNASTEHAEAILSAYELLQLLHDRGVLSLLRGCVGAGDELIGAITAAVDTPESIRAIRNFILLIKLLGRIPPDVIHVLVETVGVVTQREKSPKPPGLLHLLLRLQNENSRNAIAAGLDLLESLGRDL